jgi:hypothetical protein
MFHDDQFLERLKQEGEKGTGSKSIGLEGGHWLTNGPFVPILLTETLLFLDK